MIHSYIYKTEIRPMIYIFMWLWTINTLILLHTVQKIKSNKTDCTTLIALKVCMKNDYNYIIK